MTITVLYSCTGCGLTKVPLDVPTREAETITDWMDATMRCVGVDHRRRSVTCTSQTCDLMIPTTGRPNVGGPVQH